MGDPERLLERGGQIAHAIDPHGPLGDRVEQGELVDVLEGPASPEQGGRRAAQQHERRLRQLGVLDRRDRVGHPGPGRDGGDPRDAGEPRHRVGGEDRGGLVPHVDHPDAAPLGADQDRRDVAAAEREEERHLLRREHVSDDRAAAGLRAHHCPAMARAT